MTARDELAERIAGRLLVDLGTTTTDADAHDAAHNIAALLTEELGYRKPRTITTPAELDALGASATILDPYGCVWVNDGDTDDPWASLVEQGEGPVWTSRPDLPATVLHEP
jgi:hypothetical protein